MTGLTSLWFARYVDIPKILNLTSSALESHSNEPDQFSTETEAELATGNPDLFDVSSRAFSSDCLSYNLSCLSSNICSCSVQ